MFAGIVEESATIVSLQKSTQPYRLVVQSALDHTHTGLGDSICIDGVCLTVIAKDKSRDVWNISFDLAAETVRRTCLGTLQSGAKVNLERSLNVGDRVHGHFVFGHVDTVAELISRNNDGNCDRLEWKLPKSLIKFIAEKGSVSLSGVSLTVGEVMSESFAVYIIPHTNDITTLASKKVGDTINLEVDMLARYVQRQLFSGKDGESALDMEFLKAHGFAA